MITSCGGSDTGPLVHSLPVSHCMDTFGTLAATPCMTALDRGFMRCACLQVGIKDQRLRELDGEICRLSRDVAAERDRCKEGEQLHAADKARAEAVRGELRATREQLSDTKGKLGRALTERAEMETTVAGARAAGAHVQSLTAAQPLQSRTGCYLLRAPRRLAS
jgi:hypothetical protein